jgi:hypothetical protein
LGVGGGNGFIVLETADEELAAAEMSTLGCVGVSNVILFTNTA